jgi:hypothetical protein
MSDQYFIRVRGRVQGPFETDKLRQLARRGQFSRLHEISLDGQQWMPAQNVPDIFATPVTNDSVVTHKSKNGESAGGELQLQAATQTNAATPPRQDVWYYSGNGSPLGPVDFHMLVNLIATRQLAPETSVWREGMADWVPAQSVPGLVQPFRDPHGTMVPSQEGSSSKENNTAVIRVLDESRSWVVYLTVMIFIFASMMFIGGIIDTIKGARAEFFQRTLFGISGIVGSLVVAYGGYVLIAYAQKIARFVRDGKTSSLVTALETLKLYWVFLGVSIIVFFFIIATIIVIEIAVPGSIHFPSRTN